MILYILNILLHYLTKHLNTSSAQKTRMETETLFTASKWSILEWVSKNPSSPLEIAKGLDTTIANVSQQLRLLEAAGIVTKKKISNSDAGLPRALYSITKNVGFITTITKGLAHKELVTLTNNQTFTLRAWSLGTIVGEVLTLWYYTTYLSENSLRSLYFSKQENTAITLLSQDIISQALKKTTIAFENKTYTIHIQKGEPENTDVILLGEKVR